jgi:hypothetical protein
VIVGMEHDERPSYQLWNLVCDLLHRPMKPERAINCANLRLAPHSILIREGSRRPRPVGPRHRCDHGRHDSQPIGVFPASACEDRERSQEIKLYVPRRLV